MNLSLSTWYEFCFHPECGIISKGATAFLRLAALVQCDTSGKPVSLYRIYISL
jgi:hypothetical protein